MIGIELFKLLRESKFYFKFDGRRDGRVEIGLKDLAAFIDEYFLPRPLFEDGTPVKVGDEFALHKPSRSEKVAGFCVHNDGIFSVNGFVYDQDQRVMKPEKPEALDADGVPIKVGDTVYPLFDGKLFPDTEPWHVARIKNSEEIYVEEATGFCAARHFTHRKPDSWEQLVEDANVGAYDYCANVLGIDTRKTLTSEDNEAFLKDILRRAKALAGVDDE